MYYLREEPRGPSPYRGHDDGIYTNLSKGNSYLARGFRSARSTSTLQGASAVLVQPEVLARRALRTPRALPDWS
jgi:hypothetical protein